LDKKRTVESSLSIDIRGLNRDGTLKQGNRGALTWSRQGKLVRTVDYIVSEQGLILSYRIRTRGGEWEYFMQTLIIDYTRCHYGGQRPWFLCDGCDRRAAIVYSFGGRFKCRHCGNLTYASQQDEMFDRPMRSLHKIGTRLGASLNMFSSFPPRPKGMHSKTYAGIKTKFDRAQQENLDQLRLLLKKEDATRA
jgi:hypothetical protein